MRLPLCTLPTKYRKVALSSTPSRSDEVPLLNAAGSQGWEMVCITNNGIAYFKRAIPDPTPVAPEAPAPRKRATRARVKTE